MTQQFDPFNFQDILEADPTGQRALFFSFQNQFGRSPRQRLFFQNQFANLHNEFLGRLGQQARSGQVPTQRFTNFLENIDFNQRFASTPPQLRGDFTSRFAPRTRFLFGF